MCLQSLFLGCYLPRGGAFGDRSNGWRVSWIGAWEKSPSPSSDGRTLGALPWKRGLGLVSINVRITGVRELAVEAADSGLLAPKLANGITRVKCS